MNRLKRQGFSNNLILYAGTAISYALIMFILNFTYWLFVKVKFGLQPFGRAYLLVLLVSTITLPVSLYVSLVGITIRNYKCCI